MALWLNDALLKLCFFMQKEEKNIYFYHFFLRAVLVENIPEDISFFDNGTSNLPLLMGLYNLLDRAIRVVEIVSPLWLLNSSDYESSFQPAARQVKPERACFSMSLPPLHIKLW